MKRGRINSTFSMDPRIDHLLEQYKVATGVGKSQLTERAILLALSGKSKLFNKMAYDMADRVPTAAAMNSLNAEAAKVLDDLQ